VAGASRGIGRATALALAGAGATVWTVARDRAALAALAAEARPGAVRPLALDLTDPDAARRAAEAAGRDAGRVHVVVLSAGVIEHATLREAHVEDLDRQWAANVRAPYALVHALVPLVPDGEGDLVFVNSSVTRHPRAVSGQYAATMHAMIGVADALRAELNERGIRVLSVFPGKTATPRQEALHARYGLDYRPDLLLQPEDVAATILHAVTLPRTAEITDLHVRPLTKT